MRLRRCMQNIVPGLFSARDRRSASSRISIRALNNSVKDTTVQDLTTIHSAFFNISGFCVIFYLTLSFNHFFIYYTMQEGKVKFFNETKGFGFITPSNGGADLFVHVTGLIDEIREGDTVTFTTKDGPKGLNAVEVKVI
jgi:CspA family cold shock protein